ncbi:MAG: peptidoglycan DD-metalloendopeptidase family protein [Chromatiales bacterium]|nr:peptidoglycan DD-metalloendopeptidase family protein [Chromatiales bacterium]
MNGNSPRREPAAGALLRPANPFRASVIALASAAVALIAGYQLSAQISRSFQSAAVSSPAAVSPPAAAPVAELAPPVDPVEVLALEVRPGDTLDSLFRATSLSLVDLAEILQLDVARKYLRVLRPGDVLHVRHDDGAILELDRDLDIRSKLKIQRADAGFEAEVIPLPLERRLVTTSGKIRNSLFAAAQESRVSEKLIMNMAQIFEYDIDFVRDIGAGDEFALVYEELWRDGAKLGEGEVLAAEFVNRGARYTAIRYDDGDGRAAYYTHDGQPMRKAFVRAPLSFTRISSDFNPRRRHPILNTIRAHQGVDYSAPKGTPVKASGDGKIIFRGWKGGYGNTIILQHGGNVTTLYGHLSAFGSRSYGSRVKQGDVIGYVGATGLATAPHLHYEYRKNGVHLNPRTVILPNAEPLRGQALTAFRTSAEPLLQRLESRASMLAANRPMPAP